MMAHSSEFKPVPRLIERPWEAPKGRSPQPVPDGRPGLLWGPGLHLTVRCRSQVVAQCGWFVE